MIGGSHDPVAAGPSVSLMKRFCSEHVGGLCVPRPGAFTCFANPDHSALDAYVFWTLKVYRRVVVAHVCNRVDGELDGIISLGRFSCRKALLKTIEGEQYLLLTDKRRVAQVRCIGDDIRIYPFVLKPIIEGFPYVEGRYRLVRNLADLYRNRRFSNSGSGWTVEGLRHRDALATFDRRLEGFSYQQIAVFIYGEDVVYSDWNNPGQTMKNRIIRSVKRGQRMVDGGYKALLK